MDTLDYTHSRCQLNYNVPFITLLFKGRDGDLRKKLISFWRLFAQSTHTTTNDLITITNASFRRTLGLRVKDKINLKSNQKTVAR